MDEQEPTLSEVLQAVKNGFSAIEAKMATKDDLAALEARMATKDELTALEADLKADIASLRTELKTDIASVHADVVSIKQDVAELKAGAFTKMEKEDLLGRVKYIEQEIGIESGA